MGMSSQNTHSATVGAIWHHRRMGQSDVWLVTFMLDPSSPALGTIAEYFKVLSEASRLQILAALRTGAKTVTEIMVETGLGQANASKHLKILAQAGMVTRRPEGVNAYYSISDPVIFDLCELVCDRLAERLQTQVREVATFRNP